MKEKEYGQNTIYIENFYRFFEKKKITSLSLCLAMIFLMGIPPSQGFLWRMEFLKIVYNSARMLSFVTYIVCFYSLGYVYFKWILAVFQNKSISQATFGLFSFGKIDFFITICALATLLCSFLIK
jgi:NADH:ubiquinone oxidoreductase subunit 2 (subunit N)